MFPDSFLRRIIDFAVLTHPDDYDQHIVLLADQLIDNTKAGATKLDFEEPGKAAAIFIPQEFSISAFRFRKRILTDLPNGLPDKNFLTSIQSTKIIQRFRKIVDTPVHSKSISSVFS